MNLDKHIDTLNNEIGTKETLLSQIEKAKSDLHLSQVINLTNNLTRLLATISDEVLMPKLTLESVTNEYGEIEDFRFSLLFRGSENQFPSKPFYQKHRKVTDDISNVFNYFKENMSTKYIPDIEDGIVTIWLNYDVNENNQKLLKALLSPSQLKELEATILNSELGNTQKTTKKMKLWTKNL